jgi:uncharacterized phage protein (TIGR02220 family)
MGNTKFYRKKMSDNFTTISNDLIKNRELSWKARGILTYILSLPDDWDINLEELAKHSDKDGVDSFRSGWKELQDKGYVNRERIRNEAGKIVSYATFISDSPYMDFPHMEKPHMAKPHMAQPHMENPTLLNTNIQNTNLQITNNTKLSSKPDPIFSDVIDYLNEKAETQYRSSSSKTKTLIQARQSDGFTLDDFKKVIDNKVSEWKGSEMGKYLRPETLFGTKFESYLNQKKQASLGVDWLQDHKMKWDD